MRNLATRNEIELILCRFPVLWAMDEAQSLFNTSKYRAADYTPIEPYHLSTPRLALDFIAGRRSFVCYRLILLKHY